MLSTSESERKYATQRGTSVLAEPSEAELRPDEKVCEVTGYTYFVGLQRSPHLDEAGKRV